MVVNCKFCKIVDGNHGDITRIYIKGEAFKTSLRTNSANFEQSKRDLEQGYPLTLIQEIQTEVKFTDKKEPLCNKTKQTKEILPFVTTYNTYNNLATLNLKKILEKHWDIIQLQPKPGLLIGRGKKVKF